MKIKTPRCCRLQGQKLLEPTVPSSLPIPNTTTSTSFSCKSHTQLAVRFTAAPSSRMSQETDAHGRPQQRLDMLPDEQRREQMSEWGGPPGSFGALAGEWASELAAGATFTWRCCNATDRVGPGSRSLGKGPAPPCLPVPAPNSALWESYGPRAFPGRLSCRFPGSPSYPSYSPSPPPAKHQPCSPVSRHDPEPHPAHRKSLTGKERLVGDALRKPQSRELGVKPSGGRGQRRSYACVPFPVPE